MATWKRLALEQFPELAREIEVGSQTDLASVLSAALVGALQSGNLSAASSIATYAAWVSAESGKNPQLYYLAEGILAETVRRAPLRSQLWPAISPSIFRSLLPVFSGVLQRDATKEMEREFQLAIR